MPGFKLVLGALSAALLGLAACGRSGESPDPSRLPAEPEAGPVPGKGGKARGKAKQFEYDSVPTNPDLAVPEGFRGEVHPELGGAGRLELRARWKPTLAPAKRTGIKLGIIDNASSSEYSIPDELVALLTESTPAAERVAYGARELSVFLPEEIEGPGQMWRIDPEAAARFLRQFHAGTAMTFDRYQQPYGRRPGPAGAFGILRAVTPAWLDVLFRVHAEFVLKAGAVVYTPACFLGRMVIDRAAGTVAFLELRVPTDLSVNVNLLLTFPLPDDARKVVTNIVFEHVETMELAGGDAGAPARVAAPDALALEEAHHRLKKAFYKFLDVDWVPVERALETARAVGRPLLVAVLTSPLDDQSC